jgi:hypothetical protein
VLHVEFLVFIDNPKPFGREIFPSVIAFRRQEYLGRD